eukprot:TRINITY_DN3017_c0_g1_i1.p1 TRINITY_DN3017_c0_g1~~TRINITY_DN3017_c0_g1_i1.p1  ORF type:complete len:279 (-),score=52.49 TRINITY_DN3017_c0_g1_i1:361-1197(-)
MSRGVHPGRIHVTLKQMLHKYWVDWLTLALLMATDGAINVLFPPFHRYIDQEQLKDLMYPLKSNTVPAWTVPILALGVPTINFLVLHFARRDTAETHQAFYGLLYTMALASIVTDGLKLSIGRPRPDFFWRCFPNNITSFASNGDVICNGVASVIKEGRKSFPSGHSSWSCAGLGFFTFFLMGKLRVWSGDGHISKIIISLLPVFAATGVAVSRVDDYWHNPSDVLTGGLIGLISALVVYLLIYPPFNHLHCDVAYAAMPEAWEDNGKGLTAFPPTLK